MASTAETVRIHYRRPPDREDTFVQRLVARSADCIITFVERTPLSSPVRVDDATVLEPGAPAIWFTFPGRWHDIGRFHRTGGAFTGTYANVLTPVEFLDPLTWQTVDLFLDVWLGDGPARLLDEAEFEHAVHSGWIDAAAARHARAEARALLDGAAAGTWPPRLVHEWPLERVLAEISRPQ